LRTVQSLPGKCFSSSEESAAAVFSALRLAQMVSVQEQLVAPAVERAAYGKLAPRIEESDVA
jgi:hypothetical protein